MAKDYWQTFFCSLNILEKIFNKPFKGGKKL